MNIPWKDVSYVEVPGRYPFRDGSIEVTDREIVVWKKNPDAVFQLMRKNPVRDRVEYVLGRSEP